MRANLGSKCMECAHLHMFKTFDGGTIPQCLSPQKRTVVLNASSIEEYVIECSEFEPQPQKREAGKAAKRRVGSPKRDNPRRK